MDVGFEFEIGAPWAMRTVANKIGTELGIRGLKTQVDMTVETNAKCNGEITTPVWPLAKGISNLRRIFKWFAKNGIVTNETCGFHVNLSFRRTELNWMLDIDRLVLAFNEEKWLKLCKRVNNSYTGCYIDNLICEAGKKVFKDESTRDAWVTDQIIELGEDRFSSVNIEHLNEDSPYVEYRVLGGKGYHLRFGVMVKGVIDMAANMKRALPAGRGSALRSLKLKECFKVKGITDKRTIIPH
jgi:Fe-S cluster biosynthesis and repair protein YggX